MGPLPFCFAGTNSPLSGSGSVPARAPTLFSLLQWPENATSLSVFAGRSAKHERQRKEFVFDKFGSPSSEPPASVVVQVAKTVTLVLGRRSQEPSKRQTVFQHAGGQAIVYLFLFRARRSRKIRSLGNLTIAGNQNSLFNIFLIKTGEIKKYSTPSPLNPRRLGTPTYRPTDT
jgi:hypothetical protein